MTAPEISLIASRASGERRHVLFLNEARDVLDDDDRIIHHQSQRKREAEERERVDREAEQLHQGERSD
jgi:hypothetical protein